MPTLRLFVSAFPPPAIAEALLAALGKLAIPPHKATLQDQVHLTLQFIGETDARQLDEVRESVARSAAGLDPFSLTPESLISLPREGPARLIACVTSLHPTLAELHRRLVLRLARSPNQRRDGHFLPHITLARFPTPVPGLSIDAPLQLPPFEISSIHLMRSILRPSGAEHVDQAAFPLQLAR